MPSCITTSTTHTLRQFCVESELLLQDGEELRAAINSKLPAKIDIGPVYNVDPKHRNAYAGLPSVQSKDPLQTSSGITAVLSA